MPARGGAAGDSVLLKGAYPYILVASSTKGTDPHTRVKTMKDGCSFPLVSSGCHGWDRGGSKRDKKS